MRKLQNSWVRGRLARIFQEDAGETPAYPAKLEVLQLPLHFNVFIHNSFILSTYSVNCGQQSAPWGAISLLENLSVHFERYI